MENATKALLFAGGILLGMVVLSIGIYFIQSLSKTSNSYVTTLDTIELDKYNSHFNIFMNKDNISPQEIATTIGFAKENYGQTEIVVDGRKCTDSDSFLTNNMNCLFKYKNVEYNSEGKIIKIEFIKK